MCNYEISESIENMERVGIQEIQGQQEQLQLRADEAREAGNIEKANYFQGEAEKLENQLADMETGSSEISFGSKAGESMALKKADKEYAKHGESARYWQYLEEAAKEHRTPD